MITFGGENGLFTKLVSEARVYGEYGVGKSTVYAIRQTRCRVLAVDTSSEWIASVRDRVEQDPRLEVEHVDVGPIGDWGRPLTYDKRDSFVTYALSLWRRPEQPDLVMVDGRFRVLCFLHSLLHARPGTHILFDDYVDRPHYHVVEEVLPPMETDGRQAHFVVPEHLDRLMVEDLARAFAVVTD
jgi:hypothetical protein